ncbi:MAG: hypothetical protein HOP13_00670 [Alphaproteobacteria bacterium]|nr:hypothetical protein [Alphaproteobacteria bacterium]
MRKIPVMDTVSRTYGFLLGDIGTIVRLAWAPLLIGAALSFVYGPQIMDAAIKAPNDPSVAMAQAPLQFLLSLVTFVTGIMATVALLRVVILGDRKPGLFVYLWFGGAEMRLIAVSILLLVAIIAGGIALALVLALLGGVAAAVPAASGVVVLAGLLLVPVLIWAALRLSLISPVVVAENNLGVERSWQLMSGNVLRMFLVLLLTFVPYIIVVATATFAILGADLPAFPAFPAMGGADANATTEGTEAFRKAMEAWQLGLTKATRAHIMELTVLGFIGNLFQTALAAGAFGNAYNAVTDHQAGN